MNNRGRCRTSERECSERECSERRSLWSGAALLLFAVVLGACSSGASTTTAGGAPGGNTGGGAGTTAPAKVSKSEVIERGDKICGAYNQKIGALPTPNDEASLKDQLSKTLDYDEQELGELRKLAGQADDGGKLNGLLDQLDRAIQAGRDNLDDIASNPQSINDPNNPFVKQITAVSKGAKDYGFQVCGQASARSGGSGGGNGGQAPSNRSDGGDGGDGGGGGGQISAADCSELQRTLAKISTGSGASGSFARTISSYNPPADVLDAAQRISSSNEANPDDIQIVQSWISAVCR